MMIRKKTRWKRSRKKAAVAVRLFFFLPRAGIIRAAFPFEKALIARTSIVAARNASTHIPWLQRAENRARGAEHSEDNKEGSNSI